MQIVNLTPDQANSFGEILIQEGEDRRNVRVAIDTDGFKVAVGSGTWTPGRGVVSTRTVAPVPAPDFTEARALAWQEGYTAGVEDGINDAITNERNPYIRYCEAPSDNCKNPAETGRRICTIHRERYESLLAPA